MTDAELAEETKAAAKLEEERRRRIAERQNLQDLVRRLFQRI